MEAAEIIAGQRIGEYLLLEKLGAGGVGEVWKARDVRLNRIVALKYLALTASGASPPHALLREARAASALNHPNIITIFEVGESAGRPYLAMEFVDGETLRARLKRPPVPLDETLDIAAQILEGLAAAHRHGIIHRDLKPENIFLRMDGYVKLLDFGLAKILPWGDARIAEYSTASGSTESGAIVGTLAYLSPEQARGHSVTPASDVFSFGIVLYEMVSGEHPFRSESAMDTVSAILTREPRPLGARVSAAPPALGVVCARALEKDASKRYVSAIDLREEFKRALAASSSGISATVVEPSVVRHKPRWLQAVGATVIALLLGLAGWRYHSSSQGGGFFAPVRSVAVMNFRVEAGDQQAQVIAQGLPEELTNALSKAGIQVAAHSSVTELGPSARGRDVGAQLRVDGVIEGTVRSYGTRFNVNAELMDVQTGIQRWSGSYTVDAGDLLAGEQKVAGDISRELRSAIGSSK